MFWLIAWRNIWAKKRRSLLTVALSAFCTVFLIFTWSSQPNRSSIASGRLQVSRQSRQRMHSRLRMFSGRSSMPMPQVLPHRPQSMQAVPVCTRRGEILLKSARIAPIGQRYLHQNRSTSSDPKIMIDRTLQARADSNSK